MTEEGTERVAPRAAQDLLSRPGHSAVAPDIGLLQRQADGLATIGDWGSAAEELNRRLIEIDPERTIAMTRLARCLRERGDAEAAEGVYGRLLAFDPANLIASNFLRALRLKREKAMAGEVEAAAAARKHAGIRRPQAATVAEPELQVLVEAARALPEAEGPYLEGDCVTNVFLTVLGVKMQAATVGKAIRHYRRHRFGDVRTVGDIESLLARHPDDVDGNRQVAQFLWGNRYGNRVEWMRELVRWLAGKDLTTADKLRAWAQASEFGRDVKDQVKGLDIGAYHALIMRLGADTVNPDVELHRFVERLVEHPVTDEEVIRVMHEVARRLGRSPRQLNWSIWEQQGARPGIL